MSARIRDHDWAATPLGPIADWSDRLRVMVEQVLASPFVSSLVCGRERVLIYNDAAAKLYGDRHPAALGRPLPETFPEGWATVAPVYERTFVGETVQVVGQPLDTRGEGLPTDVFDALVTPVREADGQVAYVHMIGFEVGDRVRTEAARRESATRHRLLIETWAQAVWETDADGVVVADSPSWRAYTGQTPEEWLGYGWLDAIHPDDRAYAERRWREAIAARSLVDAEFRLRAPDGGWRWTNLRAAPVLDADGGIEKWVGMNIDIDTRKRAEAALRDSEDRFRALFASSPAPFVVIRPDAPRFTIADVNEAYLSVMLRTRDEMVGHGLFDAFPNNPGNPAITGVEDLRASVERVLATRQPDELPAFQYDIARPDGSFEERWWNPVTSPLLDANGEIEAIIHNPNDVTVQHRAEAALRESEERCRSAARIGRTGSWETDFAAGVRRWSPEGMALFGLDLPDGEGRIGGERDEWRDALHPDDRDLPARLRATFEHEDRITVEYRILRPGGCVSWLQGHAEVAARDADGHATRLFNVAADVTERRLAEQGLRESEERFRQFAASSSDALWIRDAATLSMEYVSPAIQPIYGIGPDGILGDIDRWLALIVPEDRETALRHIEQARAGASVVHEFRIRRPADGEQRWIRNTDFPLRDEHGRVQRIGGIAEDVTELKEVEAALMTAEQRQRALIEGVPQLVWRAAGYGQWTWASPQWTAFTGQSGADSLGYGWLDAYHPGDRERAMDIWRAAERVGRLEIEARIYHAVDDRYRWFQTRATAVRDEQGNVEWMGTSTDVDDLRAYQERQTVMVAELQHRTRNLLGVVRSISSQTMRNSGTLKEFEAAFNHRLGALSRVQGLLSRSGDEPITLGALLRSELAALGADEVSERILTRGPEVRLRKGTVQTFALALHELATNALKYGALAEGKGRLQVTWWAYTDESGRRLGLEWREIDLDRSREEQGPGTKPGGYGRELIERALPYVLQARTTYDLSDTELVCTIDLPLAERGEPRGH